MTASIAPQALAAAAAARPTVLVLGDSLSAEYGLVRGTGWVPLLEQRLKAQSLPAQVVNASISGDTTSGGRARLPALLKQHRPEVVVIELGGNDGLRGLPVAATKSNLQAIIDKAKAKNPETKIIIAGMRIPPNLGADYTASFQRVFGEIAQVDHATLIPFLLEGVGGIRALNQPDQIHPTAEGHRIIADLVWRTLEPILREQAR